VPVASRYKGRDEKPQPRVILAAREYESATLEVLHELKVADGAAQRAARIPYGQALAAIEARSADDYNRVGAFLTRRNVAWAFFARRHFRRVALRLSAAPPAV
jgi:hypothetical protein